MARLTATTPARWPAARRAYESEMEVPEEVHKADYEHAQRLMNNGKPSQSDVALRHNLYVRERSMRPPTAQPAIPITLSTARGLMTPRTHSRSMPLRGPNYGSQNAFQFVSTPLVRYDVPLLDNGTPPQEADLPAFGDDPADLVAEAEFPGPTIKNNLSEATAGTNEPASVSPLSGFFKKNELTKLPDAPKKQRFENFVKFIQANKDLVQEYIKKKRWSFQASTGGENAQGEVVAVPRVVGVPRWSLDPVRHGIASPVVINRSSPKSAAAQDRTRHEAPASTKPRAAHPPGTRANPDMSQERMAEYSTTDDPKMLDMAPARGGSIPNMRLRVNFILFFFLLLQRYVSFSTPLDILKYVQSTYLRSGHTDAVPA